MTAKPGQKSSARPHKSPAQGPKNPPRPATPMNCPVCSAPALPIDDACVFCHAPLVEQDEPSELLDYLVERIPIAHVKRGHLTRGPITDISIDVDGSTFHALQKTSAIDQAPPV